MPPAEEKMDEERDLSAAPNDEEIDFSILTELLADLLNIYGEFAISIGNLQKDHKELFESLMNQEFLTKSLMEEFVEKADPETVALFLKIFVKMPTVFSKLGKMMQLEPEDKIKLGEELKELSRDLRELIERIGEME